MFKVCNIKPGSLIHMYAGTGGLTKGALCVIDSNTAIEASEGISTAIVLGVAADDCDAGKVASIYPVNGVEIEADIYQGGASDTFADSNQGVLYDIYVSSHNYYVDPNDTSGAFVQVNRYDNTHKKAWIRIPEAYIYMN